MKFVSLVEVSPARPGALDRKLRITRSGTSDHVHALVTG